MWSKSIELFDPYKALVGPDVGSTMREYKKYGMILLHGNADLEELENHLSLNGYDFGIDKNRKLLFVFIDELAYVETILEDRGISYKVSEC
jgi:hypothetical protein